MSVEASLKEFKETAGSESFQMQGSKMVKVQLADETIQAKLGSMVAYQGDVKFEHAGSGGLKRMAKKAVTGEGAELMKISGSGEVFLADLAQEIQLLKLSDEAITVNGANLLAFDADIDWDIKKVDGVSGFMGGGMYNTHLSGSGYVAILSDGPPVLLELDGTETFADPQATITWSDGVKTSVKTDVNLKTFIGRGSGETVQTGVQRQWLVADPAVGGPSDKHGRGRFGRRRFERERSARQAAQRLSEAPSHAWGCDFRNRRFAWKAALPGEILRGQCRRRTWRSCGLHGTPGIAGIGTSGGAT